MKELIFIGAYCPDDEREKILVDCIESIQSLRNDFDILIVSHSIIPEYITKKVDYVFYDKNNDILTDINYLNQPWFSPWNGMTILSTYIGENSTYLSVYRIFTAGLSLSKTFKYKKVHYLEYDSKFTDTSIFYENSKLLGEYDSVVMMKEVRDFEKNLEWYMGNLISMKVDSIDQRFLEFDRNTFLKLLLESNSKTNEKITTDILNGENRKVFIRNYDEVISNGNQFLLSERTIKESMNYWTVPFYNSKENKIFGIVWNNKDDNKINVKFIVNSDKLFSIDNVEKFNWRLIEIGVPEEIDDILIMVNDKIKTKIDFRLISKENFLKTNYAYFT